MWSKEDCAWLSEGKRGKKGFSKGNERVQEMNSTRTKAGARIKKERVRKLLVLNQGFQPKRGMAMLGNQTMGLPALGLTIPQLQLLDGPFELCQPSDARCYGS